MYQELNLPLCFFLGKKNVYFKIQKNKVPLENFIGKYIRIFTLCPVLLNRLKQNKKDKNRIFLKLLDR